MTREYMIRYITEALKRLSYKALQAVYYFVYALIED